MPAQAGIQTSFPGIINKVLLIPFPVIFGSTYIFPLRLLKSGTGWPFSA
jgi:hypothetical protein